MENRILKVYDTITRKLVDIEVPQDIYDEYKKLEIKRTYIGLAKLFEVIDMIEELVNKNL